MEKILWFIKAKCTKMTKKTDGKIDMLPSVYDDGDEENHALPNKEREKIITIRMKQQRNVNQNI